MKTITFYSALLMAVIGMSPCSFADTFGTGANQFAIDFVTIANPRNPADTTGNPNPAGSVAYVYKIGKYEISRQMVENANALGALNLTLDPMALITGGPRSAMPATGVTWNEAARFVNWLNTSSGFAPAYKFNTQPGDAGYDANANIELWNAGDAGFNAANPFRSSKARYFLPSADEWYKAAYYDPNANGGTGGYWNFPTGSDTAPTPVGNGTDANTAVYRQAIVQGPADITLAGGLGPYGAMGLGGNVWEWEETEFDLVNDDGASFRGIRGGSWDEVNAHATLGVLSFRNVYDGYPAAESFRDVVGFRVASLFVPEPSTIVLSILGTIALLMRKRART